MPSFSCATARPLRLTGATVGLIALPLIGLMVAVASSALAAVTFVNLGTASSFAVLAGSGITNTGPTLIGGDIGTFPTTTISGAGSMTVTGTNHGGDGVTQGAKSDLSTAYTNAAGQTPASPIVADLGGTTLNSGVYRSASTIGLTGTLTLDAQGDPNAVFVFQAGSTLTTASASTVSLVNGAQACNVFWQVSSSATLGTSSTFRGNVLAQTSITVTTGATLVGRILANNGAVSLDTNSITAPICAAAPPTPTPTATVTATATGTPTSTTGPAPSSTPTAAPTGTTGSSPTGTSTPIGSAAPGPISNGGGAGGEAGSQISEMPAGGVSAGDGSLDH